MATRTMSIVSRSSSSPLRRRPRHLPGDGSVSGAEEVFDGDLLVLIGGVVRLYHPGEAVHSADWALAKSLMVDVLLGHDRGGI